MSAATLVLVVMTIGTFALTGEQPGKTGWLETQSGSPRGDREGPRA